MFKRIISYLPFLPLICIFNKAKYISGILLLVICYSCCNMPLVDCIPNSFIPLPNCEIESNLENKYCIIDINTLKVIEKNKDSVTIHLSVFLSSYAINDSIKDISFENLMFTLKTNDSILQKNHINCITNKHPDLSHKCEIEIDYIVDKKSYKKKNCISFLVETDILINEKELIQVEECYYLK